MFLIRLEKQEKTKWKRKLNYDITNIFLQVSGSGQQGALWSDSIW